MEKRLELNLGRNCFTKTREMEISEMIDEIKKIENSKGSHTKKNKYRVRVLKAALERRNTTNIIEIQELKYRRKQNGL